MKKASNRMEQPNNREEATGGFPKVEYSPATCPNCGSHRCPVTSTLGEDVTTVRRHKCENCGIPFTSVEEIPRVDQGIEKEETPADDVADPPDDLPEGEGTAPIHQQQPGVKASNKKGKK